MREQLLRQAPGSWGSAALTGPSGGAAAACGVKLLLLAGTAAGGGTGWTASAPAIEKEQVDEYVTAEWSHADCCQQK